MTNIKGFTLILVGILLFAGTCIYASDLYTQPRSQGATALEANAQDLLGEVLGSLSVPGKGTGTIDLGKLMSVQAEDLGITAAEYQLEVIDVSGYLTTYSRSIALGNPIQTTAPPAVVGEGEMVVIHSAANIYVSPDEVHAAKVVFRHWEE